MALLKLPPWLQLTNSTLVRFLLLFASGWALVTLIQYFYGVIAIFTAASLIAVLLNFPVQRMARYMPRGLAIALVFLGSVALLLGIATLLGWELAIQGQGLINRVTDSLQSSSFLPVRRLLNNLELARLLTTLQTSLISGLGVLQTLFSSAFTLIFTAVISLYMLIYGDRLWHWSLRLLPESSRDRFAVTFQRSFVGFLQGQLLLIAFLTGSSFIVFVLLGINYALILALVVGILDAIPGIGATLGVVTIAFLILAAQGWASALKVIIASVILQQIQDNFVAPKVMSDELELNPVVLFLALFVGDRVAGILGIFLAIPIAGMIAAWLQADQQTRVTTLLPTATHSSLESSVADSQGD